jgi:hypothetical protein
MFETHARHYIIYYINVNCFSAQASDATPLTSSQNGPDPFSLGTAAPMNRRGIPLA